MVFAVFHCCVQTDAGIVSLNIGRDRAPSSLLILPISSFPLIRPSCNHWSWRVIKEPPINRQIQRSKLVYGAFSIETHVFQVGAGSAGAVVANRLSEDYNSRVLLLEAGGDETIVSEIPVLCGYLQLSDLDWKYKTVPQPYGCLGLKNRQCNWPRGKVLGGSSTINYMIYIRGNRRDYDQWAKLGNYGWSWEEVLPYFLKSEDNTNPWQARDTTYHNTGGYLTVSDIPFRTPLLDALLQGAGELGYPTRDLNGEFQTGIMAVPSTTRGGARCSTAKAFLRPASVRPNLQIVTNAHVVKILFDDQKRASGVIFDRLGKRYKVSAKKEVILSAGSVSTPQLLMLSGVGPRSHLESLGIPVVADLPGVGQNLQDHMSGGGIVFTIDYPVSFVQDRIVANPGHVLDWLLSGRGPLASPGGIESVAFVKTSYTNASDDWPDMELHYASGSAITDRGQQLRHIVGLTEKAWQQYFVPIINEDTFYFLPTLLRPKSVGFIRLRSTNPYEHPIIDPKYYTHPDDIRTMVEGIKIAVAIGNSKAMKKFGARFIPTVFPGCESFQLQSDEYFACLARFYSSTLYHPVGTAKMGVATDSMAVVDPELRVYQVKGLRVIDASIMPLIVSGNTNAPIIMIAEKASDLIKRTWKL